MKTSSPDKTDFKQALRVAGFKATTARLRLLQILSKAKTPMGIQEIFQSMGSGSADQATVYRTLESLAKKGLVRQIDLRHGHADFELADKGDHHHLICLECGKIADFSGCNFNKILEPAMKTAGFERVLEHNFELYGVCKSCARHEK